MSDALPILILYGSQSGNSEEIAVQAGKAAISHGLTATVKAMDETSTSEISASNRVLICCSTWGDGEQPDNAEDLWEAFNADENISLEGVSYSVLALGDSSYDLFCESGKEWDNLFDSKGANRIYQRVDCDVDYEELSKTWMDSTLPIMASVENSLTASSTSSPEPKTEPSTDEESNTHTEEIILNSSATDLESFLTSGDRSLSVLFGSQSGNSEELASKIVKESSKYGLLGKVYDMDGFDFNTLPNHKRVLIVCSTWGEGEMPDNAEELWKKANSETNPILKGVNFSVLSLGDSSYELFCQSGKDWDRRFEELGGNRLVSRIDCDVDYDSLATQWTLESLIHMSAVDGTGNFQEDKLDLIRNYSDGSDAVGLTGDDDFKIPSLISDYLQVEVSIFRYDPETKSRGKDTWLCSLPGHMSVLDTLRTLKSSHDGTLTFRDGHCENPNTAISINGRLILPGTVRLETLPLNDDRIIQLRLAPLPCFEVVRDLLVDTWKLERKRESSKPWMVAATREGKNTPQGPIGVMAKSTASDLHSIKNFSSFPLLHACSDTTPFSEEYIGPSLVVSAWARRNDPRTSINKKSEIDAYLSSSVGIKAETDLSSIRRQSVVFDSISDALLDAKTSSLNRDSFNGRHGKHVWWYTWSVKSSGKVNDTVIFRQVLGPLGLLSNLFSGVTARMLLGFTRTGGNMINDGLGMVLPPAGIGKMPRQFNSSVGNHHEVVAIFNELDGRF
jgi:flavodoxin/succinate dehydrogenase/fumarate reductase-like Fe-S protein